MPKPFPCLAFPRLARPLAHVAISVAAALSVACAPFFGAAPVPGGAPGVGPATTVPQATMVLDPVAVDAAKAHLSGKMVSDYSRTLVSAASRWTRPEDAAEPPPTVDGAAAEPAEAAKRRLMALGDPLDPDWPAAGLDLRSAPYSIAATDRATNGMAVRNTYSPYGKRVYVLTQAGKFFGLDPNNPATGFTRISLPGVFTKTYITLSPEGSTAFVVNDAGTVFAINVAGQVAGTPPTHNYKTLSLSALGTARGTALFMDPMSASMATGLGKLYVVDNQGRAHRLVWSGTGGGPMTDAKWTAATITEPWAAVDLGTTAFDLADEVRSPPVVLNNRLIVGDRGGKVFSYQYSGATGNAGTLTSWTLNYGFTIETPCALDVDNNLNVTDVFAAAGAQLFWIKPSTGTVYTGQYALVEGGGNDAIVHAGNFSTYVTTTSAQLKPTAAADDYTSFSSTVGTAAADNAISLPGSANGRDIDNLSYAGFISGVAPTLAAFCGQTGRRFHDYYPWDVGTGTNDGDPVRLDTAPNYSPPGPDATHQVSNPVQDGTVTTAAQLLSPSAIEFDDDGSYFVADTQHCQVLFTPANATAWERWFPTSTSVAPTTPYDAMTDPSNNFNWLAAATAKPNDASSNTRFYVFAGTLYPNAPNNDGLWSGDDQSDGNGAGRRRDVGNGSQRPNVDGGGVHVRPTQAAAGVFARGTAINRVQGLAVGNLGLYIANRNAFLTGNPDGQILFMPRNNLPAGTYFGITNPQPGRLYVIANFTDPQGIDVWRGAGATRDIVFAPSMDAAPTDNVSMNRVYRIDSTAASAAITMANCRIAGLAAGTAGNPTNNSAAIGQALNNPYDVSLDDCGNLFIAQLGNGYLSMIAKAVSPAEGAPSGAAYYGWGTAGTAGNIYNINTGLTNISSVTFAANDPQVPAGQRCLYIALGATPPDYEGTVTTANRIVRMDQSLYYRSVAGPPLSGTAYRNTAIVAGDDLNGADAGDGLAGDNAAVRLSCPWRARGRFNAVTGEFETYICDRANNRIRVIRSAPATASARGYLCFPWPTGGGAHWGKPIYQATLSLFSKSAAGNLTPPVVALTSPRLKDGVTAWNNTILALTPGIFTATQAPDLNTATGQAFPIIPTASLTTPWNFLLQNTNGDTGLPYDGAAGAQIPYQWRLPAPLLFTSNTNADFQHLRLGLQAPTGDGNFYYYPTSTGTYVAPNVKSANFWTTNGCPGAGAANFAPRVDYRWGTRNIGPVLSAPTIVYRQTAPGVYDGTRYVYLMNANALWRFDVTSPTTFIDGTNGAQAAFAKSIQGQPVNGTIYAPTSTFQFNSTAPMAGLNGEIYAIDIKSNTATDYSYYLNEFNGDLAPAASNMYVGSRVVDNAVPTSSTSDNSGVFMAADGFITETYVGLADGRIYRMMLNPGAP